MHEFSLATGMIEAACEEARAVGASRIRSITCRVGILRQIDPELMCTAFEMVAAGTPCEAAELKIVTMPVRLACPGCGHHFDAYGYEWGCPTCGADATCLEGGDELELISLDVEEHDETALAGGGVR